MKKTSFFRFATLLVIIFTHIFAPISAQNALGIRIGTQLASFRPSSTGFTDNPQIFPRLLIAVPLALGLSDNFALQIEPSYLQKGSKWVSNETRNSVSYSDKFIVTLNYLELPILAKFKFGQPNARFGLVVGPSFGYGLNAKSKYISTANGKTTTENSTTVKFGSSKDRDLLPMDFGLVGGIGLELQSGFGFDIRYALGLKNIDSGNTGLDKFEIHNNGIQFALSYMLPMSDHRPKYLNKTF